MRCFLLSLLCCSVLAAASPAAAAGSRKVQAEGLTQRGNTLLATSRTEAACQQYEAVQSLESSPGTLFQLGDCYVRAGRTASAWHAFLEAEAIAAERKDLALQRDAAQRAAALEPRLTRVVLLVPGASRVPGLTVQLGKNTIPASAWGTAIPVDAGVQEVSASAKGYRPWQVSLDASQPNGTQPNGTQPGGAPVAGAQYSIQVPQLSLISEPNSKRRNAYRTAGVVTGGLGLAGLGAGAVFNALSRSADDASTCTRGVVQCSPTKSDRGALSNAATVSLAVGGTLLATGVTLFVLAPSPDRQENHALRVTARVLGSSTGRVQLEGVW